MKNIIEMKFQVFAYFLLILPGFSCSDTPRTTNLVPPKIENKDGEKNKPPGSFSDTVIINTTSAVFYNPDSLQLEKIKAISDTMIFESIIHDCFYQMRNARIALKENWPHIRIIEISKARYLLFIKEDNSQQCIDLNTKNDMCGIVVFNRIKDPVLIDIMNINTSLDFYFKK